MALGGGSRLEQFAYRHGVWWHGQNLKREDQSSEAVNVRGWLHYPPPRAVRCRLRGHSPKVVTYERYTGRPGVTEPTSYVICRNCQARPARAIFHPETNELVHVDDWQITDNTDHIGAQLHVSRKNWTWVGVSLGIGGRGSETPIDLGLHLFPVSLYLQTSSGGILCEKLTRGHGSRELGFSVENGYLNMMKAGWPMVRWHLWYNKNEMVGLAETPKWSEGRVDTGRWIDWVFGKVECEHEVLAGPIEAFVTMPEARYPVTLTLERWEWRRSRRRKPKTVRYQVDWNSKQGIPTQNHDWKGDEIYGSSVEVGAHYGDPHRRERADWVTEALGKIVSMIATDRVRNSWVFGKRCPVCAGPMRHAEYKHQQGGVWRCFQCTGELPEPVAADA